MGWIADTVPFLGNATSPPAIIGGNNRTLTRSSPATGSYSRFAGSYAGNEIVYSCIELLASSAGEPIITGRRHRRNKAQSRAAETIMRSNGLRATNARLVRNGFVEDLPDHPLVQLLNNPNPFMSRGQLWGTVVMDKSLAGNSYLLKVRAGGPVTMPLELWRLRPDKVKIIPGDGHVKAYEYDRGGDGRRDIVTYPANDIIHFKERNPLDEFYGMPPLLPVSGRIDIDGYMTSFLRTFFERGGTGPGSILSVKNRLTEDQKDEIRTRARRQFGGTSGFHEWLVLDQTESSYTQLGLDRGLRDALPKELDAMSEARIAMIFGIPGSILGLLIGYESSSYANKRQDWQTLWDVTMAPMLSDMDDVLNLSLVPEFPRIDEVLFDMDDIKALQEDVDAIQERERKNFLAGATSFQEFRDAIGYDPDVKEGIFYISTGTETLQFKELGSKPDAPAPGSFPAPAAPAPDENGAAPAPVPAKPPAPAARNTQARCPDCNKLLGKNIKSGAKLWCDRCNKQTTIGDPPAPAKTTVKKTVERDAAGLITAVTEEHTNGR